MNRAILTALQRIRRAPYQTFAAVSIMTMTLFLASVFFIIAVGSQLVLRHFEGRPQVIAFFNVDVTPDPQTISQIKNQLEATGLVKSFSYVSKEDALQIYLEANKNRPFLTEAVTSQMLPASIEISAVDPRDLKTVAAQLKKQPGIEDVPFAEDIVASLTQWTSSLRLIGGSLVLAHIFITLIIILLIIGLKVGNRRDEIRILELVGATPGYISLPFIFEGVIYGLIGAVIAWIITYSLLLSSMGFLNTLLAGIPILPVPAIFMLELLLAEIIIGSLVGSLGGLIATRRFLRS
jgi:cell division transport system permease protein